MNTLDVIKASVYQAALDDNGWAEAASSLRQLVRSDLVAMATTDTIAGRDTMLHGDCGPYYMRLYQELRTDNPFVPAMKTAQEGDILTDKCLTDREEFTRTNFFDNWLRPQRQHSAGLANISRRNGVISYFMFSRGGRITHFGERELSALRRIQPTLRQALDLRNRLAQDRLEQTGRVFEGQCIGWLAVETGGKVIWANRRADDLLASPGAALSARHSLIRAYDPSQTQRLVKALRDAAPGLGLSGQGSNIIFRNPETGSAIAASLVPAGSIFVKGLPEIAGAYLALQDLSHRLPDDLGRRIGELFGLTTREVELAIALARGQTLAESAAARGLSMPTVRTQLAQLLRKTGTGRQSQLVALLLTTLPFPFIV